MQATGSEWDGRSGPEGGDTDSITSQIPRRSWKPATRRRSWSRMYAADLASFTKGCAARSMKPGNKKSGIGRLRRGQASFDPRQ